LDAPLIKELFSEIKSIAVSIAILNTKLETRDKDITECQKEIDALDIRIKILESFISKTDGANLNSASWKETMYRGLTIVLTIFTTAVTTVGVVVAVIRLFGG